MIAKTILYYFQSLLGILFFILPLLLQAEGTKQIDPNATDYTKLMTNNQAFGSFGTYDGDENNRLFIHVADPSTELVYLGFSRGAQGVYDVNGNYTGDSYTLDYYFRIVAPDGTIAYGPTLVDAASSNVLSRTDAISGPAPIVGLAGYTPFVFDPTGLAAGDYYIEFSNNQNTVSTASIDIPFFDITVAKNGAAVDGRLWSYNWALKTSPTVNSSTSAFGNFDRTFNGSVYAYTNDGFVNKLSFDSAGFRAWMFTISLNATGPGIIGNELEDRRSFPVMNGTSPQFKIFLNDPDEMVYPSGKVGSLVADPEINRCNPIDPCIWIEADLEGQIEILVDLEQSNGFGIYNVGTADVLILKTIVADPTEVAPFRRCIEWNGLNGFGETVDFDSNIDVYAKFQQGVTHYTAYDVEYIENGFTIDIVRPVNADFNNMLYYDDSNISVTPGNGSWQTRLNGCTFPCHSWSNINFGNANSINTWWFSNTSRVENLHIPSCVPTAKEDSTEMDVNSSVVLDVLSNDLGSPLVPSTVAVNSPPLNGTVAIDPTTGEITYKAISGFTGEDRFWYEVCNANGFCDDTWVIVDVIASALPVELGAFELLKNNCEIELNWTTESEENLSHFEIERSLDGNTFSRINSVQSMLNEQGNTYFFSDSPTPGKYYYRLKSIDLDAKFSYSRVLQISTNCVSQSQAINVFPNPVYQEKGSEITIVCMTQRENPVFEVININGKIVKSQQVMSDSGWIRTSFDLSDIPSGTYFLRSKEVGMEFTQKILKID